MSNDITYVWGWFDEVRAWFNHGELPDWVDPETAPGSVLWKDNPANPENNGLPPVQPDMSTWYVHESGALSLTGYQPVSEYIAEKYGHTPATETETATDLVDKLDEAFQVLQNRYKNRITYKKVNTDSQLVYVVMDGRQIIRLDAVQCDTVVPYLDELRARPPD